MSASATKNTKYWINTAIVLFCFFGFDLLPSIAGLSTAGMRAVGIFIGLLWGWITIEFAWVSLVGIFAMGTCGVYTMTEVFSMSFGSATFLQILFPLILFAYMDISGFTHYLGYKIIASPMFRGRPWMLTGAIFAAAAILTAFVTFIPAIFLTWKIVMGMAHDIGYTKDDEYIPYTLSGIVFMQTAAGGLPWMFYPITLHALMKDNLNGMEMPFMELVILSVVAAIVILIAWLVLGKFIFKIDASKLKNLPDSFYEEAKGIKLTTEVKVAFIILIVFLLAMALPSFMPATWPITILLKDLGLQGVSMILLAALLILRYKNGEKFATTSDLATKGMIWDVVFLCVSTVVLASLLKHPDVGVVTAINESLIPIVAKLPKSVFMIACLVIFWFVTQFTHNFVIVAALVGSLSGVCVGLGIHPWCFAFLFMIGMNFAYCTPAASSPGALMFGNGDIGTKAAYKYGIWFSIVGFIIFIAVCYPLCLVLFNV